MNVKALTIETILKNYERIILNVYYMHKTTGDETNVTVTMTQGPGGNVGGVDTVKVMFIVTSNKENEQGNLTLWMSKDYSTVVRIDADGQTVEGQLAEMYGQQVLRHASALLMPYAHVGDIHLKIAGETAAAVKAGWEVTSVTPTTVSISGHSYRAYSVAAKNVADTDSIVSDMESTVAEISPNVWVLIHMHANMKDGSVFNGQILELVPKT